MFVERILREKEAQRRGLEELEAAECLTLSKKGEIVWMDWSATRDWSLPFQCHLSAPLVAGFPATEPTKIGEVPAINLSGNIGCFYNRQSGQSWFIGMVPILPRDMTFCKAKLNLICAVEKRQGGGPKTGCKGGL